MPSLKPQALEPVSPSGALEHPPGAFRIKLVLLALWVAVSFGAAWFARDLQRITLGDWPLGYWLAAQGAVLSFIAIVVAYALWMRRLERRLAHQPSHAAGADADPPSTLNPYHE